jgi:hypothetical protein
MSDFGRWSEGKSDDSRVWTRDASTENIYTLDVDFP